MSMISMMAMEIWYGPADIILDRKEKRIRYNIFRKIKKEQKGRHAHKTLVE